MEGGYGGRREIIKEWRDGRKGHESNAMSEE